MSLEVEIANQVLIYTAMQVSALVLSFALGWYAGLKIERDRLRMELYKQSK